MPARRLRVHPEEGLPYTPLSVHRPVTHRNGSAWSDNVTTAFVPLWLLRIAGDVCSICLVFSRPITDPGIAGKNIRSPYKRQSQVPR
jgi:hypothetical protein